ncbi:MAG: YdcF family protein [Proteobacteria bacterium]|nr:YdcF family protein [Pseudomonadota bacterium]MBU1711241.1 YdcF family protein [Pseudomonadota bacterium]
MLKKFIAQLFFPLPMIAWLLAAGLILLWFSEKQKTGKILATAGFILFVLLSNSGFSSMILSPFEKKVPPDAAQLSGGEHRPGKYPVRFVIVLSGGHATDPDLPVTSYLSHSSLVRLVEGIRLMRYYPGSRLLLSGGKVFDKNSEASSMKDVALGLGVDERHIVLEEQSRDTNDQARLIKAIVGDSITVLVTSASHMPRALAMFHRNDMRPIPAPTGHLVQKNRNFNVLHWFPSAENLRKSERAFYETLGTLWAKLRGQAVFLGRHQVRKNLGMEE